MARHDADRRFGGTLQLDGLLALARRIERGVDRFDEAVMRDLATLAQAHPAAVEAGGDFRDPGRRRAMDRRGDQAQGCAGAGGAHVRLTKDDPGDGSVCGFSTAAFILRSFG